ncbi:MAG: long-chain fatty acid--CoA ligase [Novosphingobium sp.]|nr:long-chain fatty acid--CoA ligase [Novosphingobium sp.]
MRLPEALAAMIVRALARDPARPAIEYQGRWFTWSDLRGWASVLIARLAQSGIAADAPVAFVPRNRPIAIAAFLGLLAAGRSVRMIYAFQSPEGVSRDIARLGAAAVVLHGEDFTETVEAAIREAGIAAVVLEDDAIQLAVGSHSGVGFRPAPEPVIEILTSGTTGPPKQFPISQRMIAEHHVGSAAFDDEAQAIAPPALLYFPLGNISGIYSTIPPLVRGQRACLLDRFSIDGWRNYVVEHRPAHSGIPPASMGALLEANIPREDLASLKAMGLGAAPLDPALQATFEDRYGIPILQSYGATEFGGPVCAWTPELHARWGRAKLGSVGRAMPGAKLRVVDPDDGRELPAEAEGLLEVVSPRIGAEWIRTADIGAIDPDGFLFLRGRADGAIVRGGFKLLPETIERALLLHPAVAEAVVVAVPDARLGEVPAAAVRLACDSTPAELEAHLRRELPATHIPVHWRVCESLPRNPSLKLDRAAIRQLFNA